MKAVYLCKNGRKTEKCFATFKHCLFCRDNTVINTAVEALKHSYEGDILHLTDFFQFKDFYSLKLLHKKK